MKIGAAVILALAAPGLGRAPDAARVDETKRDIVVSRFDAVPRVA